MSDCHVAPADHRRRIRTGCWLLLSALTPLLCSCQSAPPGTLLDSLAHRRLGNSSGQAISTVAAASVSDLPAENAVTPIVGNNGALPVGRPVTAWQQAIPHAGPAMATAAHATVVDAAMPPGAYAGPETSIRATSCPPAATSCLPPGPPHAWPSDEYICDGGDGEIPATVGSNQSIRGLEPEDTVLHYDTLAGRAVLKPSNRVCIYAPRFAAVRKVTGVELRERHQRVSRVEGESMAVRMDDLQIATHVEQPLGLVRQTGTKGPNVLDEQLQGIEVGSTLRLVQERRGLLPYEDFNVMRRGLLADVDETELAERSQAALVWTLVQAVQLVIDGQQAEIQARSQTPGTIYQYEIGGEPRMQVVKMASTRAAQPGEFVDFTIYFDNIGTQRVNNVTIVDNLTPRLQYVPDSQQCSREASFTAERNEGESLLLRWDMNEPLEPNEGGVIRFRCQVR
jgi:uncharacterized repeat protein (TIGR01451 family)